MKKIISVLMALVLCIGCLAMVGCNTQKTDFTVGICQLMEHPALNQATEGFKTALTAELAAAGKTVSFEEQVPGDAELCTTVVNTFTAKNVDLILGNATPALLAAANATTMIPVLGTSVTDYADTFNGNIPANVSGTSDAVPFDEQAKMIDSDYEIVAGAHRFKVGNTKIATEKIVKHPELFNDYEITKGDMDTVFLAVTGKKLAGDEK